MTKHEGNGMTLWTKRLRLYSLICGSILGTVAVGAWIKNVTARQIAGLVKDELTNTFLMVSEHTFYTNAVAVEMRVLQLDIQVNRRISKQSDEGLSLQISSVRSEQDSQKLQLRSIRDKLDNRELK